MMRRLLLVGLGLAATGCGGSVDPVVPSPLVVSVVADSTTASAVLIDHSYQCVMTFKTAGLHGRPGEVATLLDVRVTVVPTSSNTMITSVSQFPKAVLGFDEVGPGQTLQTKQTVFSGVAPFSATLTIGYVVNDGRAMSTAPSTFRCA